MKKKKRPKSALKIKAYAKFVDERDRAAERMLGKYRLQQTDILRKYFRSVYRVVAAFILHANKNLKLLDHQVNSALTPAVDELAGLTQKLRKLSFALAAVSEAEALGRAIGKKTNYDLRRATLDKYIQNPSMAGGHVRDRIVLFLDRFRRDIVDALQLGLTKKETPQELFSRAVKVLPKYKRQRIVHELSKIKESKKKPDDGPSAEDPPPIDFSQGFVDDTIWNQIVADYTEDYIPQWRGPEYEIDPSEPGWPDDEKVYATDIEREMTEDFVKSVRDGQVEAANQNGVDDFVWIAVIDEKTCEDCCIPRDGLLSSEIEKLVDDGDIDCDAITPPAHINCRCRLAPAIDSDQEPVTVDMEGFSDWANS